MRFPKTAVLIIAIAAISLTCFATPKKASAQSWSMFQKTYKVQVEYWFFDTDYYYWETKYESSNLDEALMVYELLMMAKENGELNEVVPASYWRYIAMDVRMITEYHYPDYYKPWYGDLELQSSASLTK